MNINYQEPARELPVREFDVLVAGGGTAGVVAALAAARQGATTALIEAKGYPGGIVVEGGTALHSFYNLWKAFPQAQKRQVVKGIPQEIIDRLVEHGGTSGHAEVEIGSEYDSVCTAIDTEIYKVVALEMLREAGVQVFLNSLLVGAVMDAGHINGAIVESRSGRECFRAKTFIDSTGYGDLSAFAGATFIELNDHPVANSMGVAGVDVEAYRDFFANANALTSYCSGPRYGEAQQVIRVDGDARKVNPKFAAEAEQIGMSMTMTTIRKDYFMFIKLNYHMPVSPTDRDAVTQAELELRKRQLRAIALLRKYIPGCEHAFIARTSPSLTIRRGRSINCDYDITIDDILTGRHFADDIMAYGFHDCAPRLQVKDGGTYGVPYAALRVAGIENLLAIGMMITSNWEAHMSTRNTVCCMGQGQAAGTAAALCAQQQCATRDLPYALLRERLIRDGVHMEH